MDNSEPPHNIHVDEIYHKKAKEVNSDTNLGDTHNQFSGLVIDSEGPDDPTNNQSRLLLKSLSQMQKNKKKISLLA